LAGYAELGITGLMPSAGLCRVLLRAIRPGTDEWLVLAVS